MPPRRTTNKPSGMTIVSMARNIGIVVFGVAALLIFNAGNRDKLLGFFENGITRVPAAQMEANLEVPNVNNNNNNNNNNNDNNRIEMAISIDDANIGARTAIIDKSSSTLASVAEEFCTQLHHDKLITAAEILSCLPAINTYVRNELGKRGESPIPDGKYSEVMIDLDRQVTEQRLRQQQQQQQQQQPVESADATESGSSETITAVMDGDKISIVFPSTLHPVYESIEPVTLTFQHTDYTLINLAEKLCRHVFDNYWKKDDAQSNDVAYVHEVKMTYLDGCIIPVGEYILKELRQTLNIPEENIPRGRVSEELTIWLQSKEQQAQAQGQGQGQGQGQTQTNAEKTVTETPSTPDV